MKVLLISRYVDPEPVGSNKNVYLQARALTEQVDLDVSILTWPHRDLWGGPLPSGQLPTEPITCKRGGVTYHVFTAPDSWNEMAGGDSLGSIAWDDAVLWGQKMLTQLNPDIVHLHHRHGLWWLLDAAQKLGIKTVYTNHDWGIGCVRTVLVKGNGDLCGGIVTPRHCAECVKAGRGFLGRMNEALVELKPIQKVIKLSAESKFYDFLKRFGLVEQPAETRLIRHFERAQRIVSRLSHCVTPSNFGKFFFGQFGLPASSISVLPWYSEQSPQNTCDMSHRPFTITYIGRISPEKGVHQIFQALNYLRDLEPLALRIAGALDSDYARSLQKQYPKTVAGKHFVAWLGWSLTGALYGSTDVSVIPSQLMDNTPLTLLDSLAHRVPVVATNVPTIAEYLIDGETGFLADYDSPVSLACAIRRAYERRAVIRKGLTPFPPVMSLTDYMENIAQIYRTL